MKLIRRKGRMVQIGEDQKTGKWYYLEPEVETFAEKIQEGDEVEIGFNEKGGAFYIHFIKKVGYSKQPYNGPKKSYGGGSKPSYQAKPKQGITPQHKQYLDEKQESIVAQAIGHMTSRTLIALQGIVTEENLHDLIESIYDHYVDKVRNTANLPPISSGGGNASADKPHNEVQPGGYQEEEIVE